MRVSGSELCFNMVYDFCHSLNVTNHSLAQTGHPNPSDEILIEGQHGDLAVSLAFKRRTLNTVF